MYKLLVATNKPDVIATFADAQLWEEMGFRAPRIIQGPEEALLSIKKYRADCICCAYDGDAAATMARALREDYPSLPVFPALTSTEGLKERIVDMRQILNQLNADFSNDVTDHSEMLRVCRHDFLRMLMGGQVHSAQQLVGKLQMVRSRMDPTKPCAVVDLQQTVSADFFAGRWHYGRDRLEMALRNFFGAELDGRRIVISVLPDERIRLLCCPMLGEKSDDEHLTEDVKAHLENAMDGVRNYLGLDLSITGVTRYNTLTELVEG
ncbi:MAG: hypothetical protein Q4C54_08355 [Clostridia bacterium]|nr:hypothetical protein [Clostridia bacterium]